MERNTQLTHLAILHQVEAYEKTKLPQSITHLTIGKTDCSSEKVWNTFRALTNLVDLDVYSVLTRGSIPFTALTRLVLRGIYYTDSDATRHARRLCTTLKQLEIYGEKYDRKSYCPLLDHLTLLEKLVISDFSFDQCLEKLSLLTRLDIIDCTMSFPYKFPTTLVRLALKQESKILVPSEIKLLSNLTHLTCCNIVADGGLRKLPLRFLSARGLIHINRVLNCVVLPPSLVSLRFDISITRWYLTPEEAMTLYKTKADAYTKTSILTQQLVAFAQHETLKNIEVWVPCTTRIRHHATLSRTKKHVTVNGYPYSSLL